MPNKEIRDREENILSSLNEKIELYQSNPFEEENIRKELEVFEIYICDMLFHKEISEELFKTAHGKLKSFFEKNQQPPAKQVVCG